MKYKVFDTRELKMYSAEEVEDKNWALGSNGIMLSVDEDSFKDGQINYWLTDWRKPLFSIGKLDTLENEVYQGDILKFTLDPVLAHTVSGGGDVECFLVAFDGTNTEIYNANFKYDLDIMDSPAVLTIEVIGNVYTDAIVANDFIELGGLFVDTRQYPATEEESFKGEKVKCDLCSHQWIAVYHEDTEKLECPNCENLANFEPIETEEL
jgi:hypothetical protein